LNISAPFIRRPVATSLLAAAILLSGILAYWRLPVAPLPRVDFPTIQVSASLPGASPETMASSVATPLERRFGRIAGLTEMTSSSTLGATSITLQFDLDRNVDAAARDVQAAIAAAGGELPPDLPLKPTYRKVNPADAPTLILALRSDTLPLSSVFDAANTILAQKISQVHGVGQAFVAGGQQPAVRVQYDPLALAGMRVGSADLRSAIAATTVDEAKGTLVGKYQSSAIGANDQVFKAEEFKPLVVAQQGDATAKLGQVATVYESVENERVAGWADGKRSVLIFIRKQPDANILEVNARILALLPQLASSISPAIDISINSDRTQTIRASVIDVEKTLGISMVLVVMVVFAFLRSWRATLVPAVAMPLSLVGTFGVMWLLGYSIDNLSLMALTISTGFVVDDAIVVTENITRAIERGVAPFQASLDGAKQIGFTIVTITVSLIAVFAPILLMGGIVGRLFREFAVTLSVAVAMSALVSLTLTPMMCARLLRSEAGVRHGWFYRALERTFDAMLAFYEGRTPLGAAPPGGDAHGDAVDRGTDRRALRHGPQGSLPPAGHGPHHGVHRGRARRVLRGDAAPSAPGQQGRRRGPGRRPLRVLHGLRRLRDEQHGQRVHHAQAAPSEAAVSGPGARPAPGQTVQDGGGQHIHAGAPRRERGRAHGAHSVPVHRSGRESRRTRPVGAPHARGAP
jgi:multidrug efflux pump